MGGPLGAPRLRPRVRFAGTRFQVRNDALLRSRNMITSRFSSLTNHISRVLSGRRSTFSSSVPDAPRQSRWFAGVRSETVARLRATVVIDEERCKGCDLCVVFCPEKVLEMTHRTNRLGWAIAELVRAGCTGCEICGRVCPDTAITILREPRTRAVAPTSASTHKPTSEQRGAQT